MAEEEVVEEVEAVLAVYGDDCTVLETYPPHLHIHHKPRTADITSQQFVEAVIAIRAGPRYPDEAPHICIIDSKGLDDQRQKLLVDSIRERASELSSCLMLVALFEEAVERLTTMNHPDGDCPLCLYPLVDEEEEEGSSALPFMKLMSCFHCFHSECIIRWWNWLQIQNGTESTGSQVIAIHSQETEDQDGLPEVEQRMGICPVCRKPFHVKDIEHVLDLVGTHSEMSSGGLEVDDEELLQSDLERIRRQKFEAILKQQQDNNGLIEPKKNEVLLPGVFLQRPVTESSSASSAQDTPEQQMNDSATNAETIPSSSSNMSSSSTNVNRNTRSRGYKGNNSRKQVRQWIRRESAT